jgi:hypothetical protein
MQLELVRGRKAINVGERVAIRLIGGPANDFVLSVPADRLPPFLGVGQPIAHYRPDPGEGEVRLFRHVPSDAS